MMLRENDDELLPGTLVRALNNRAHHLIDIGYIGTISKYLPKIDMYKVWYRVPGSKVILANVYRTEFEVITDDD